MLRLPRLPRLLTTSYPLAQLLRLPPRLLRRRARRARVNLLVLLLLLALLLVVPFYILYKPPPLLIRYFAHRWPDVLWQVALPAVPGPPAARRPVALTIDDAPSEHTRDILARLAAHGARATFFVIGAQVPGREDVLEAAVRAGHELGNHALRDEASRALGVEELGGQMGQVQRAMESAYRAAGRAVPWADGGGADGAGAVGGSPKPGLYFRPGSGFFSDRMRLLVKEMGYRMVLGSIYPHDPQIPYAWVNARHILSMLRPGGIIVCHDRRSWTAPMLDRVLPALERKGYKAVTITELLAAGENAISHA